MEIGRSDTLLMSPSFDDIFGIPTAIGGDWSLATFLRAAVIHSGVTDPAEIKALSKISYLTAEEDTDFIAVSTAKDAEVTIVRVEDESVFKKDICVPSSWVEFASGAPFINKFLSQFSGSIDGELCGTRVFANSNLHRVLAWVYAPNRISGVWLQAFMSVLPTIMSWRFPPDSPYGNPRVLGRALSYDPKAAQTKAEEFLKKKYCADAADKIDAKGILTAIVVDKFANSVYDSKIECATKKCETLREQIRDATSALGALYSELESQTIELSALSLLDRKDSTGIRDFFAGHKDIDIVGTYGDTLKYSVTAPLQYYDVDEYCQILDNPRSWLASKDEDDVRVLTAILRDRLGVLRVSATFTIQAMRNVGMCTNELHATDCAPNPHVYKFNCAGANGAYYSKYAESGAWDMAIEQSCSATRNLNVGDGTVFSWFFDWIFATKNNNTKFIWVNPDLSPLDPDTITDATELISMKEFKKRLGKKEVK